MTYTMQARLAADASLQSRVAACAASEGLPAPESWAFDHRWQLSALPGWVEKYEYAYHNRDRDPGENPAAISDDDILAGVQAILATESPAQ